MPLKGRSWAIFVRERFDPGSHALMIAVFVLAQALYAQKILGARPSWGQGLGLFVATCLFFFKLRAYDEIKDYELDVVINPGRPLPRGLLTHCDLHQAIAACIVLELGIFAMCSWRGSAAFAAAILYSLLMFKEFFIGKWLRPHLTTYAVTHTVVSTLLSLALISAFCGRFFWDLPPEGYWFALASWPLFNLFEFGRKTFAPSEERAHVESYSRLFSRPGAVILSFTQLALFSACLFQVPQFLSPFPLNYFTGLMAIFLFMGTCMAISRSRPIAQAYRFFCNLLIVLCYSGAIISLYLLRG